MEVPVFLPASQILARLLTVDANDSGLNANTLQGYVATDFALSGHTHSGGGGTPGGSNTQVQFNDSGAFGGDAGLVYDKTTDTLTGGTLKATSQVILPNTNNNYALKFDGVNTGIFRNTSADTMVFAVGGTGTLQVGNGTISISGSFTVSQTYRSDIGNNTYLIGINNGSGTYNQGIFWSSSKLSIPNNQFGIGTITPNTQLDINLNTSAAGTTKHNLITMRANQGSGVGAGYGTALRAGLTSSTTADSDAGRITWEWADATHATRASKGQLTSFYTSTERPAVTWGSNSTVSLLGFHDVTTPIAKPTITGSRGGNAALADLLTQLANYGLIVDSTTV